MRRSSPDSANSTGIRLQKILAAAGVSSRRGAEDLLRAGRVTVNGARARLGDRADPDVDVVSVDGEPVGREPLDYWVVHKPRGVITSVRDPEGRPTVMELLPPDTGRLFPVGRLDRDTEGLVLMTNDGALAQALLHPSHETEREYDVTVRGRIAADALRRLARGVRLDDGTTAPARVGRASFDARSGTSRFALVLVEGRKRQIRRACRALGHVVVRLVRVRMGPVRLGRLSAGAARRLGGRERRDLLRLRDRRVGMREEGRHAARNHVGLRLYLLDFNGISV
jgi:23S rRNA pseudouridine2605 synthase